MVEKKNILFVGGDERYLEIIKAMSQHKAHSFLIGYDNLTFTDENVTQIDASSSYLNKIDAVILPVSGADENGKVSAQYTEEDTFFSQDIINTLPEDCVIYSGIRTAYTEKIKETTGFEPVYIFERDDLSILNSIPTAEGSLQIAMEETDYTVHGSDVLVLGFGRIGITIARLFANVGAHVTVAVRKPSDRARIIEMGLKPVHINDLEVHVNDAQIVINTIKHPIVTESVIQLMNEDTLIIDLASQPGGTDFEYAKERGIKAIHALGLPGRFAPKTAGQVLGDVLVQLIGTQSN